MQNQVQSHFDDKTIPRFDADTIKNRYGNSWRNLASNVREITQPDGSIIKEYIIEDPSLLEQNLTSTQQFDSTISNKTFTYGQEQPSSTNNLAQIKAKFEQRSISNVMASPMTSTITSSDSTATRGSVKKQMDDSYAKHRRTSDESITVQRINDDNKAPSNRSSETQNSYHRSQSLTSEQSKTGSFRRFESTDEADEEVRKIHQQGEQLRYHKQGLPSTSSVNENLQQTHAAYEVLDEDGNPLAIDGIQDLIKTSGARIREVPQPDGTIIKEYVIDDPEIVSKLRSQQTQQQPQTLQTTSSYTHQGVYNDGAPPPPPRIPLRPSMLFRPNGSSVNDNLSYNIQQIQVLEPQRRYEYLTRTGRRIQFEITNSNNFNGQYLSDSDIRELINAMNSRVLAPSTSTSQQQQQSTLTPTVMNRPKQWYPSVDFTHRQRAGSDSQPYPNNDFQQIRSDLPRSTSHGELNQQPYISQRHQQVSNEPVPYRNTHRYQDSHGQINIQRHQSTEAFQTPAQFLPARQTSRSTYSPSKTNNHPPIAYQQSTAYPYQGQQQHGVRILNDFNQSRTTMVADGHNRI